MPERRIVTIERVSEWLRPFVRPSRRQGHYLWLDPDDVPNLTVGSSGKFEIERERKKGAKWRIVRQL